MLSESGAIRPSRSVINSFFAAFLFQASADTAAEFYSSLLMRAWRIKSRKVFVNILFERLGVARVHSALNAGGRTLSM